MPIIFLRTEIHAPIDICFDLARSIDLHMISTKDTGEKAISGRTSGLIKLGESVTWKAKHLGFWQTLTSRITAMENPSRFVDEMEDGPFDSMWHEHTFTQEGDKTVMKDEFHFESPLGIIGIFVNDIYLTTYLTKLLQKRNAAIKLYAENGQWKEILKRT